MLSRSKSSGSAGVAKQVSTVTPEKDSANTVRVGSTSRASSCAAGALPVPIRRAVSPFTESDARTGFSNPAQCTVSALVKSSAGIHMEK